MSNVAGLQLAALDPRFFSDGTAWTTRNLASNVPRHARTFIAPKTGMITKLGIGIGAITASQPVKWGIQTVASTGKPSGTVLDSVTLTPSANSLTIHTLASGASVTEGTAYALVQEWSGTAGTLETKRTNVGTNIGAFFEGSSSDWFYGAAATMVASIGYSDGSYPSIGTIPAYSIGGSNFTSSSTPDEMGVKFTLPYPALLRGLQGFFNVGGVNSTFTVNVTNSAGTSVLSKTFGTGTVLSSGLQVDTILLPATVLTADTYRLSIRSTSATTMSLYHYLLTNNTPVEGFGLGPGACLSTRKSAGAWTDDTVKMPMLGPVFSGFEAGGGGTTISIKTNRM